MASKTQEPRTGVFHNGNEVAVRAKTRYSRSYHEPKTDGDGDVVFFDRTGERVPEDHDDARPKPACGKVADVEWKLVAVHTVERREACRNCREDDDAIAERNRKGADNITLARLAQRSDWEGAETLSGNNPHISGD